MFVARLRVLSIAHPVERILYCVVVLLLFACGVAQQCLADNLRTVPLHGVYVTDDGQLLQALARRTPGTYWIDGYRMTVSKLTQICWHHAALQFISTLNRFGQPISNVEAVSPCDISPPSTLGRHVWLQYVASQKYHFYFTPQMNVVTTRIDAWIGESNENQRFVSHTEARSAWQNLCASASPHQLLYPNEDPIDVVCDAKVNSYVERVFSALLRLSTATSEVPKASREIPSFYIVKPFEVRQNYDFEAIDGYEGRCDNYSHCSYVHPRAHSIVREIAYARDSSVLIPETALAYLKNEAELAALLSYSLMAKDQDIVERLFRVQRLKVRRWGYSSNFNNVARIGGYVQLLNEQMLRLGIRQMYLAGYDIRYAPFAWAVEQGKRIKGPVDEPNKHMPWYATYAFNAINQLYPNVDYSKLKRGEAEYAKFLIELRKADPSLQQTNAKK